MCHSDLSHANITHRQWQKQTSVQDVPLEISFLQINGDGEKTKNNNKKYNKTGAFCKVREETMVLTSMKNDKHD